jgi:hypothetical protein
MHPLDMRYRKLSPAKPRSPGPFLNSTPMFEIGLAALTMNGRRSSSPTVSGIIIRLTPTCTKLSEIPNPCARLRHPRRDISAPAIGASMLTMLV